MAAQQMNQTTITAIAERIVQARRLYGPDSAYIIGLFLGLELAHEGDAGSALRAKVQEGLDDIVAGRVHDFDPERIIRKGEERLKGRDASA